MLWIVFHVFCCCQKRVGVSYPHSICLPWADLQGITSTKEACAQETESHPGSCSGAGVHCSTGMDDCTHSHRNINSWPMPACKTVVQISWVWTESQAQDSLSSKTNMSFQESLWKYKAVSPAMPKEERLFSTLLFDLQHYRFACCCCCCFWGLGCIFPICRCDV